ncbi:MAG: type II toxin-antitoxin system death-on-curing family toxin [Verrucomicrobia bacterium]|nr:type II toxin-antitoxin system death-on-curing family toxin [Verrucomicrobiota bacterium]
MKEPVWVLRETVLAVQEELLAQFGGSAGLRDEHLLDSALARPQHLFAYGKPTVFELAASYGFGLAKNHPFVDGNKRIGFTASVSFLELNGYRFQAEEADAVVRTLALAAGEMSEAAYAEWLKANSKRA